MNTAQTSTPLSLAERKAELARMVSEGKITEAQAALIDLRDPTPAEKEQAEEFLQRQVDKRRAEADL